MNVSKRDLDYAAMQMLGADYRAALQRIAYLSEPWQTGEGAFVALEEIRAIAKTALGKQAA